MGHSKKVKSLFINLNGFRVYIIISKERMNDLSLTNQFSLHCNSSNSPRCKVEALTEVQCM